MLASPVLHATALVKRWKPEQIHRSMKFKHSTSRSYSQVAVPFTYRLAAASAAKRTAPRPPKHGKDYWNYSSVESDSPQPHLQSRKQDSGEDAFFITTVAGNKHHVAFGLADGVGGWQDQGVDPSHFSQGLCEQMAEMAHNSKDDALRPQVLLQQAFDAVMKNSLIRAGGSTASLAVVDEAGVMETANLGDSGYVVLGPGKVAHRSKPQTHAFNTPYQLSKIPTQMQTQHAIFGGASYFSESPSQADINRIQLKHGDLVVFATDGVWDNLSAQDTMGIVTRIMEEKGYWFGSHNLAGAETLLNEDLIRAIPSAVANSSEEDYLPAMLATAVMRAAKLAGLDRRRDGPFAKEVKLRYPQEGWEGGKPDDIAVVVCVAVQETDGRHGQEEKPLKAKL